MAKSPDSHAKIGFTPLRRFAENGFTPLRRFAENGFTLVELMVALAIFAIVSAAGVMLLRASIDTQSAVAKRLGEGSGIARFRAIMASELASAQPRPGRDGGGSPRAAMVGSADSIDFVHASGDDPARGRLGRSSYRLADGALVRSGSSRIDGNTPDGDGDAAPLLRDIVAVRWRYRGIDGGWSGGWQPDDPARLPRAVELTVERTGTAPLTMRFLVGPDGLPPPGEAAP
jgi:general secretion pathway protein J